MELHMVFYYAPYGSMAEASDHPDGLVVLAFMYSVSNNKRTSYNTYLIYTRFEVMHVIQCAPKSWKAYYN